MADPQEHTTSQSDTTTDGGLSTGHPDRIQGHKPLLISFGEVLWDLLPESKIAGGAPTNFAYHASRNGVDALSISAVGKDELGDELEEAIRRTGVPYLFERSDYPTGTAGVTLSDDGTASYSIAENVAWDHITATTAMVEKAATVDAITFGTLACRSEQSRQSLFTLLEALPRKAMRFFDLNLRGDYYTPDLITSLLKVSTHVKMNASEFSFLRALFSIEGDNEAACKWLFDHFPSLICVTITAGRDMSFVAGRNGEISLIHTPRVKEMRTVGAGDVFSGTLAAELLKGSSLSDAHQRAVNTAAYVCTQNDTWPEYPQTIPDYVSWQKFAAAISSRY